MPHRRKRDCPAWDDELGCLCNSSAEPRAPAVSQHHDQLHTHKCSHKKNCVNWDDELGCCCGGSSKLRGSAGEQVLAAFICKTENDEAITAPAQGQLSGAHSAEKHFTAIKVSESDDEKIEVEVAEKGTSDSPEDAELAAAVEQATGAVSDCKLGKGKGKGKRSRKGKARGKGSKGKQAKTSKTPASAGDMNDFFAGYGEPKGFDLSPPVALPPPPPLSTGATNSQEYARAAGIDVVRVRQPLLDSLRTRFADFVKQAEAPSTDDSDSSEAEAKKKTKRRGNGTDTDAVAADYLLKRASRHPMAKPKRRKTRETLQVEQAIVAGAGGTPETLDDGVEIFFDGSLDDIEV
eukprot:TRINITY_DN103378_c0_g1_i1.p1 TRINITY_DN103378_c0_g1~~TRINITY_DN103378_c0_g1_i1.p1  ORF type:complete len:392 (+),score=54.47 TRINITY_DN103378_c0_g1_i1:130-1176(+)